MTRLTITCDRQEDLIRCAVWQGKELLDLYLDRASSPDHTGAIVRGKIVRIAQGGAVAWVDAGLEQKLYVESKTPLKSGAMVTLKIKATMGQGKAWPATLMKDEGTGEGILTPPPLPWERALGSLRKEDKALVVFAAKQDFDLCQSRISEDLDSSFSLKEPVHPDLDERIDALLHPVVALAGGGSLVIEQTQALVAIDVNSGEAMHAAAVNLQAVREAARQIRLRNLSGIIVLDCLKMKERADISKVVNAFSRVAENDPAKVNLFGMSKLGLLELTRTRLGPSLAQVMAG